MTIILLLQCVKSVVHRDIFNDIRCENGYCRSRHPSHPFIPSKFCHMSTFGSGHHRHYYLLLWLQVRMAAIKIDVTGCHAHFKETLCAWFPTLLHTFQSRLDFLHNQLPLLRRCGILLPMPLGMNERIRIHNHHFKIARNASIHLFLYLD